MKLVSLQNLVGKTVKGDPRTRNKEGALHYQYPEAPNVLMMDSIAMKHDPPKKKDKYQWHWFNWEWVGHSTHLACNFSGVADLDNAGLENHLLVDE